MAEITNTPEVDNPDVPKGRKAFVPLGTSLSSCLLLHVNFSQLEM